MWVSEVDVDVDECSMGSVMVVVHDIEFPSSGTMCDIECDAELEMLGLATEVIVFVAFLPVLKLVE